MPNPEPQATDKAVAETAGGTMLTEPPKEGGAETGNVAPPSETSDVKYELKLPKDSYIDDKRAKEITEFAKANKLSPESAQALIEQEHGLFASYLESVDKSAAEQIKQWQSEVKAKYGEKLNEKVTLARRAVERFDPTGDLRKALDESGYGDHPLLVNLFVAIGETMAEDTLVPPGGTPVVKKEKSAAEIMYGKTTP